MREVFPELQSQGYLEWLEQVYRSGRRFVAEHQPLRLETVGEPVRTLYLDFIYEPLTDETGQVIGIFCQGQDVTEAHLARAALEASERRFRTALEIETVGALCFDAEGRLIDANDAFLRMSGHDRADLAAGRIAWPAPRLPRADAQAPPEERCYRRRDDSTGWALVAAKRLPDGSAFEFLVDISDRKQAEAELREETRTLEALKRIDTELASELDLAHLVQTVTDAGVELTGARFGAYFSHQAAEDGAPCVSSPYPVPSASISSALASPAPRPCSPPPWRTRAWCEPTMWLPIRAMASPHCTRACRLDVRRCAAIWPSPWWPVTGRCWVDSSSAMPNQGVSAFAMNG